MSIAAFAVSLQVSALQDWKRPAWGASAKAVSQQLGSQITQDQMAVKSDILGMDELVHGQMTFRDLPSNARFFFSSNRLSAITVKPQNPKSCSGVDEKLRAAYGTPLMSRRYASIHGLLDAWDDPRTGDRITLQGTDGAAPAPYCTVTFGPPRHDKFNRGASR